MKRQDERPDGPFTIAVIGLGLMGGSIALALKGFENAVIIGVDRDESTRRAAVERGAVEEALSNPAEAISRADLVILCVYPAQAVEIVEECAAAFKPGVVVTDICGVKSRVVSQVRALLPGGADYVPCHPMAGRERGGFANADENLFKNTGFIITPLESSKPESMGLIRRMAEHTGASRIASCSPEEHDGIIAYTSHLCHISALALCLEPHPGAQSAFTGGSFRDCTRVANIDPVMWSALFIENSENVLSEIDRLERSLSTLKGAIERGDGASLQALIDMAGRNKRGLI